jgi:lysophospholipase L1-like esterase
MVTPVRTAERSDRARVSRFGEFARVVWVNVSLLICGLVLAEFLSGGYYLVRAMVTPRDPVKEWVNAVPADAYADRSWLTTGFAEALSTPMRWTPYTYWRRVRFAGHYVNTDERGLRKTWNPPSANPVKIYIFGGSTMWGTGARDDYTIASCLSKLLARKFPSQVRVTNFGETGYVNTQEMVLLLREIQARRVPEIVIFYDGHNDTFGAFQSRVAGIPHNESNRVQEFNLLNTNDSAATAYHLIREALRRSNTFKLATGLHSKVAGEKSRPPLTSEQRRQLIADMFQVYSANAAIIESVGEKSGFASLFYWQPSPLSKKNPNHFEQSRNTDPELIRFMTEMYAGVGHAPISENPSFHNISDVFGGYSGTLYIDYAHTTERGNEMIAERMYKDVVPLVERRIAQR